jgi:hypothetical protein
MNHDSARKPRTQREAQSLTRRLPHLIEYLNPYTFQKYDGARRINVLVHQIIFYAFALNIIVIFFLIIREIVKLV